MKKGWAKPLEKTDIVECNIPTLSLLSIRGDEFGSKVQSYSSRTDCSVDSNDLPVVRRTSNVSINILDSKRQAQHIIKTPRSQRIENDTSLLNEESPHLKDFNRKDVGMNQLHNFPEFLWIERKTKEYDDKLKGVVDVAHKLLGDNLTFALVNELGLNSKHLHLQDNGLTDAGIVRIINALANSALSLESIDISDNQIKRRGIEELSKYFSSSKSLMKISLRKMNLNDRSVRVLCTSIANYCILSLPLASSTNSIPIKLKDSSFINTSLTSLHLSDNKIEDSGAVELANLLSICGIKELDLSWNSINFIGAIALANAIRISSSMLNVDLSWNSIGSSSDKERDAAKAISLMLSENSSLTHLDLSQNQLSISDISCIGEGLKKNHSLLGLHITGNQGKIDAYGQLAADAQPWPLESAHSMTRIIGKRGRVIGRESWALRNACWICGCWQENCFKYNISYKDVPLFMESDYILPENVQKLVTAINSYSNSNTHSFENDATSNITISLVDFNDTILLGQLGLLRLSLLTSFDNWVSEPMKNISATSDWPNYELFRMVPPGTHFFIFQIYLNGISTYLYDPSRPFVPLEDMISNGITVPHDIEFPSYVNTTVVVDLTAEEKLSGIDALFTIKPRSKNEDNAVMKEWQLEDSLFYPLSKKFEPGYFRSCFAMDWTMCKSSKIKDAGEVGKLEDIFFNHFQILCDIFYHYCCLYSGETFFMTIGAFNEFIQSCGIMDASSVSDKKSTKINKEILPDIFDSGNVLDDRSKNQKKASKSKGCTRTDIDMIFISNTLSGPKHEYNSKRSLIRFQFWDCLVSVAQAKYVTSGINKSLSSALEMLMTSHILPFAERDDRLRFRQDYLLTEAIDKVVKKNLPILLRIFKAHSGLENLPLEPATMCLREWIELCETSGLSDAGLNERPTKLSYCRSKALDVNILSENATYKKMSFLEFVEAAVRAAKFIRESFQALAKSISRSTSMASLSPSPSMDKGLNYSPSTSVISQNKNRSNKATEFLKNQATPPTTSEGRRPSLKTSKSIEKLKCLNDSSIGSKTVVTAADVADTFDSMIKNRLQRAT